MTKTNSEGPLSGKFGPGKIAILIGALAALITSITPGVLAFLEGAGEKVESSYEILSVEINVMKEQRKQDREDMREMREWIYGLASIKHKNVQKTVPGVSTEASTVPLSAPVLGRRPPRAGSASATRSAVSDDPLAGLGLNGGGVAVKSDEMSAESIVKAVKEQKQAKQVPIKQQALPTSLGAAIKGMEKGK